MLAKLLRVIPLAVVVLSVPSAFCQWNGQPPLPPSCGADRVKFKTSAGPVGDAAAPSPPGMATIYAILEPGSAGLSPTARIGVGGSWIGALHGPSFLRSAVVPGALHLCTSFELSLNTPDNRTTLLNLDVEPGKSYYLLVRVIDSRNGGIQDFQLISADEGRYLVSQEHLCLSVEK